jgi:DNA-binding transcriptional LysR family regulator
MRDLESEVGTQLLQRSAQEIEFTAAGRAFLDHAKRCHSRRRRLRLIPPGALRNRQAGHGDSCGPW